MHIVVTRGIFYKFNKYSDRAAIAFAYTEKYGNIKLFVPSIANKNSVLVRHIPGTIHLNYKPNSDLHKLITFHEDLNYAHYLDTPEIYTRLSMVFEMIHYAHAYSYDDTQSRAHSNSDGGGDDDTQSRAHSDGGGDGGGENGSGNGGENSNGNTLWYLLGRYNHSNPAKLTLYILFTILNQGGYMFAPWRCSSCGQSLTAENQDCNTARGVAALNHDGEMHCAQCTPQPHTITATDIASSNIKYVRTSVFLALQSFYHSHSYTSLEVDAILEHELLDLLFYHGANVLGYQLHAYRHYRLLMPPPKSGQ